MLWFIISLAILAGAIVFLVKGRHVTAGVFGMAAIFLAIACVHVVPTRNVGIVTSFGKPTGRTADVGINWTAPWQDIDDWDASRNTFNRLDDACLWVSVSGGRACIPVQIEWSAREENAPADWAAYKEVDGIEGGRFGTFVARRINPQMDAAITATFVSFNPLGTVDPASGGVKAPDLNAQYREPLRKALEASIGGSVTIDSIAYGTPSYDQATTNAISAFGQKVLEKRNLAVDKENADLRAEINRKLAAQDKTVFCIQEAARLGKEPGLCMTSATPVRPIG